MEIRVAPWSGYRVRDMDVEVVERKGIGHPDSLTDGMVEAFSRALSRYYLETFGRVLHHNVDKALLVGGHATPRFGGGDVEIPMRFYLVGRATDRVDDHVVPLEDLYQESVKTYLKQTLRHLDVEHHIEFSLWVRPGSPDLVDLFLRSEATPLSNDTSYGVGFYPLSETERLVLSIEQDLNSPTLKEQFPWVGEDVKVMAIRRGRNLDLTLAVAFVSAHVQSFQDYFEKKHQLLDHVRAFLSDQTDLEISVAINTADAEDSVYLTVTGTSAEGGDDGQVGRGNRVNGLITPLRPMTLEAAAGKNPISHVGKLYNVVAQQIAEDLVHSLPEVEEAHVLLVSEIGKPITEPQLCQTWVSVSQVSLRVLTPEIRRIVARHLESLPQLYRLILEDQVRVF